MAQIRGTIGALGRRPVQNHSQTMAFVNQLFDGDAVESNSVGFNEREHFTHSFALIAVGRVGRRRAFPLLKGLQGFSNHIFGRPKMPGLQPFVDDLRLLGCQLDIHDLASNPSPSILSEAFSIAPGYLNLPRMRQSVRCAVVRLYSPGGFRRWNCDCQTRF
jgi:hypothetical protein